MKGIGRVVHSLSVSLRYHKLLDKLYECSKDERLAPKQSMMDRLIAAKDLDTQVPNLRKFNQGSSKPQQLGRQSIFNLFGYTAIDKTKAFGGNSATHLYALTQKSACFFTSRTGNFQLLKTSRAQVFWIFGVCTGAYTPIWEFPKIRGTLFWGPYNKDPTI